MSQNIKNILVIQLGFLGDIFLSTPVIRELKNQFPEASISVLTTPLGASVFANNPIINEVITYDKRNTEKGFKGLINLANKLKSKNFSDVFSLHKSWRTSSLVFLSKIKNRYGFKEAAASFVYTKKVTRSEYLHEVRRNLAILKNIDLDPASLSTPLEIVFSKEVITKAESLIPPKKFVVIAPGSVWNTKKWDCHSYAETANMLYKKGYQVLLVGSNSDKKECDYVEKNSNSINLVGKTSPIEAACIISKAQLLICNDSAPLHMASATKTPVVAIFCATVKEFGFGPWQVEHRVVENLELSCRPCGTHGGNKCPIGTFECSSGISSERVFSQCLELLP